MLNWRKFLGLEPTPTTGLARELAEAQARNRQAAQRLESMMADEEPVISAIRRIIEEVRQ